MKGRLVLLPVGIGADHLSATLPALNLALMNGCYTFIVEELRTARRFLKSAGYPHPFDTTTFHLLNEHTDPAEVDRYLAAALGGDDVGLLSEAGLPCVADPGALAVRAAHRLGIRVVPLVGPSSIMLTLMASGLGGQDFAFVGYLPIDRLQRQQRIRRLEELALRHGQTQLFIEAPYRNNALLDALLSTLRPDTMLCTASDLTMPTEQIISQSVAHWRERRAEVDLHKRNTVFALGR